MTRSPRTRRLALWACALTLLAGAGAGVYLRARYAASPRYCLRNGTATERQWAIRELAKQTPAPDDWPHILSALDDSDLSLRLTAVAALSRAQRPDFAERIWPLVAENEPLPLRLRAVEALAEIGRDEDWPKLAELLRSPAAEIQALSARLLGRYGRRESLPQLVAVLRAKSETVRQAAAEALDDMAGCAQQTPDASLAKAGKIVWEAERGMRIRQNFELAPSPRELAGLSETAKSDPLFAGLEGYSGDGWLRCLEGAGGNHDWLGGESATIDLGRSSYPIVIPHDGRYTLWARTWWMDKCGNSYQAWVDHLPQRFISDPDHMHGNWRVWHWMADPNGPMELTAGPHLLTVQAREDGIRIDQFCLIEQGSSFLPPLQGGAKEALAPNLEPLALAPDGVEVTLARESEVVDSQGALHATVRLLRCGFAEAAGTLEINAEDGVLDCAAKMPVRLGKNERVFVRDFSIRFDAAAPCRERVLLARFTPDGKGEPREARLIISKPWPWLIAGPFELPRNVERLLEDLTVEWKSFAPENIYNRYGTIDFERAFGNGASGRVFLKTRLRCEKTARYLWLLNSDDNAAVWLDGQRVIENPRSAPAEGFITRGQIEITEGEHNLVAAVFQSSAPDGDQHNGTQNQWLFRLRIRTEDHTLAPVSGFRWQDAKRVPDRPRIEQQY